MALIFKHFGLHKLDKKAHGFNPGMNCRWAQISSCSTLRWMWSGCSKSPNMAPDRNGWGGSGRSGIFGHPL